MNTEELDAYVGPTIEKAEALNQQVKVLLQEGSAEDALLETERLVTFDLTPAERIKMLSVAIVIIAQLELEGF